MPQLVLAFPGFSPVCYSAFLCVFETTAAGVSAPKRDGLNICFMRWAKCRRASNYVWVVENIQIQQNGNTNPTASKLGNYCPPPTHQKRGFSNIKQTRICECLCKIKMNVRLKQTSVDYGMNVTSCTSSFYPTLLSYNVASLVSLTMI